MSKDNRTEPQPAAPTQIDAAELEAAINKSGGPRLGDPGYIFTDMKTVKILRDAARAHLSKLSGGDAPQSDMVVVPRTILEVLHQSSKLALGNYDYQCGYLDAVKEAKSLLQPYTKGE